MKPEAQRLAIAKVCGWEGCSDSKCDYRKSQHLHKGGIIAFPESYSIPRYPDYLNDLNAMHVAEQTLTTTEQQNSYYAEIAEITWGNEETGDRQVVFNQLTATAAQRAEAFLKTLLLWEEVSG
jgi:hypothetical protein